jgi:hypothetical protein
MHNIKQIAVSKKKLISVFYKQMIAFIMLCVVLIFTACRKEKSEKNNEIKLKISLAGNDTRAMGGYVLKWLVGKSFANGKVTDNLRSFEKWHRAFLTDNIDRTGNVYFIASPRLLSYKAEVDAMVDFVDRGNTLFVAANYFDPYFLEQFSLSVQNDLSVLSNADAFRMRETQKQLLDTSLFNPHHFSFYFFPLQKSFAVDTALTNEVMGVNDFGHPDFIRMTHGKGQLLVMTNANAVTNYFLLTKNNYKYALGALSYLPGYANGIYWDDFYRRYSSRPPEGDNGLLSFIFNTPALNWAFWILIALAILWMLSHFIRSQRMIPVRKPNVNSSLEFTQTIARLYFNKKDNRNIAMKMIAYFQDHVRSKYYMNYTGINDEFGRILAAKTGLEPEKVLSLIKTIQVVQSNATTDDDTLLTLNSQIQDVLKR